MTVIIKRIYEPASKSDGYRVFVDRLWARGLSKQEAHIDLWLKEVAPSDQLRTWFAHDPAKWEEFKRRYKEELRDNPTLAQLRNLTAEQNITLLYGAKDQTHNQAVVLKELLQA